MVLTELQENLRRNVIATLKLISSREEQLEYQRQVPIAFVTAEIFCLRGDDAYNVEFVQSEYFCSVFLQPELRAMEAFTDTGSETIICSCIGGIA